MLSLEKCKQILNAGKDNCDIEKIKIIREFLYRIAKLEEEIKNDQKRQESPHLHESINRRTGAEGL